MWEEDGVILTRVVVSYEDGVERERGGFLDPLDD